MANTKPPPFESEAQEADWWAKNQDFIADRFEQAKASGKLGKGTVARSAREQAGQSKSSPTVTIRLAKDDLSRAQALAAHRGLSYQNYIEMLLHEALDTEEKRSPGP